MASEQVSFEYTYAVPAGNAATVLQTPVFASLLQRDGGVFPATAVTVELANNTDAVIDNEGTPCLLQLSAAIGGLTQTVSYGLFPYGTIGAGAPANNFFLLAGAGVVLPNVGLQLSFSTAPAGGGTVTVRLRFWRNPPFVAPVLAGGAQPSQNQLYGANFYATGGIMQALNPAAGFGFIHHIPGAGNLETADLGGSVAYITAATTTSLETSPTAIAKVSLPTYASSSQNITLYDSTTATGNVIYSGPVTNGATLRINCACATGLTIVTAGAGPWRIDYFITA